MDNANNFRTNQPRAQRPPEAAFATARANLLVASILTAVNIVLILVNANMSFMFSMYAPQEACGVVFNAKAIVPCRGFCVLALAFASCPPPEAGAGASARSPSEAALPVLFRRVFLFS